jgi:hypothetical protein
MIKGIRKKMREKNWIIKRKKYKFKMKLKKMMKMKRLFKIKILKILKIKYS